MKKLQLFVFVILLLSISCKENPKSITLEKIEERKTALEVNLKVLEKLLAAQEEPERLKQIIDSLNYDEVRENSFQSNGMIPFKYSQHIINTFPYIEFSTFDEKTFLKIQDELTSQYLADRFDDGTGDLALRYKAKDYTVETYYPASEAGPSGNIRYTVFLFKKD